LHGGSVQGAAVSFGAEIADVVYTCAYVLWLFGSLPRSGSRIDGRYLYRSCL
jgi:hypothetical protein